MPEAAPPAPEPVPLAGFSLAALRDSKLDEPFQRLARLAMLALDARGAMVRLRDSGGGLPRSRVGSVGVWVDPSVCLPPGLHGPVMYEGNSAAVRAEPSHGVCLGVPLRSGGDEPFGALWVVGRPGRRWSARDLAVLRDLTEGCVVEVRLRLTAGAIQGRSEAGGGGHAGVVHTHVRPAAGRPAGRPGLRHTIRTRRAGGTDAPSSSAGGAASVRDRLRERVLSAIHLGQLQQGDRLPSIRQVAADLGTTAYAATRSYQALEEEGVVVKRPRSGIFVAPLTVASSDALPETAEWLAEVLTQMFQHQIRLPVLPRLIQRWTAGTPLRCLCVESTEDGRVALCHEIQQQFGLDTVPLAGDAIPRPASPGAPGASRTSVRDDLPPPARDADLVVATVYDAARVRPLAAALGRPLLLATEGTRAAMAVEHHLRNGHSLTVVCVDPAFGERLRTLHGGIPADRIHIVLAGDAPAVQALDSTEPVLLTQAARQRLGRVGLRLITTRYPCLSHTFARQLARAMIRLNLYGHAS